MYLSIPVRQLDLQLDPGICDLVAACMVKTFWETLGPVGTLREDPRFATDAEVSDFKTKLKCCN